MLNKEDGNSPQYVLPRKGKIEFINNEKYKHSITREDIENSDDISEKYLFLKKFYFDDEPVF
ncbi:MAG: hypothetical protein GY827_06835 [Cytophagales bacterium]|nr:hypothetical protein [Cytophagales bacterium]